MFCVDMPKQRGGVRSDPTPAAALSGCSRLKSSFCLPYTVSAGDDCDDVTPPHAGTPPKARACDELGCELWARRNQC